MIAGRGAVGRIIVGALLIVGSFLIPGAAAFLGIGLQGLFFTVGASLVLGGVAQLLSPTPLTNKEEKDAKNRSYSFSGIQNTSRQGVAIPIIYGEVVTGSVIISAFIDVEKR